MRIATWNVNSLTARWDRVEEWIRLREPDVLCLQETKQDDAKFPFDGFASLGYESVHHGEGRWNGVAIVSRIGLEDARKGFGTEDDEAGSRIVAATCGGITVMSCYVPNGRALDDPHYEIKLRWLDRLSEFIGPSDDHRELVAAGDFNVAPCDADVWDPSALAGMTHVSVAERERIDALISSGLEDVVRSHHSEGGNFSWWDYRNGSFHRGWGMRIDLVLCSARISQQVHTAWIDRDARKGPKPSDHAPVVVDLDREVPPIAVSTGA